MRRAGPGDLADVVRLRLSWHGGEPSPGFADAVAAWSAGRTVWLAGDPAVGMVNLALFDRMPSAGRPPAQWGYLANLFVEEHARGRGLGSALVGAVVDEARARGLVRLVLSPSERSRPLYARHGFRAADELLVLPL